MDVSSHNFILACTVGFRSTSGSCKAMSDSVFAFLLPVSSSRPLAQLAVDGFGNADEVEDLIATGFGFPGYVGIDVRHGLGQLAKDDTRMRRVTHLFGNECNPLADGDGMQDIDGVP